MTRKQRRFTMIGLAMGALAVAASLVFVALEDTIVFFYSPTDIVEKGSDLSTRFRLGGLVAEGSVERNGEDVEFVVSDTANELQVTFAGILPDLFREGQGVVVEGTLSNGVFVADTVLAKHDENYMPAEVADKLREQGYWQGSEDEE
jgi:cytochrome c-type biogenesis protein CcmE